MNNQDITVNKELHEKHRKLTEILKSIRKACIAFSGGVDSSLLLKVARDTLDEKKVLGVTAVSNTYTAEEQKIASQTAKLIGAKHILLATAETEDPDFIVNPPERCYHCKKNFYAALIPVAHAHGFAIICDGSNLDDLADYRPGKKAGEEYGVRSPLIEAGMGKEDVRALSRELGLPHWDRPANPCLASRIPYGTEITGERLSTVEKAEGFIRSLGFTTVRVRHHETIARIELPLEDALRFMGNPVMEETHRHLKGLGFTWVALDIGGYRTGSMNESIADKA